MPDTGFKNPSAFGDNYTEWQQPVRAYTSDNQRASANDSAGDRNEDYYNFSFGVPAGATIVGIEASIEGRSWSVQRTLEVRLSWNGGSNWTSYKEVSFPDGSDGIDIAGGAADTWGRAWLDSEFSNANFRIHGRAKAGNGDWLEIDHIQIKVYYTTAAGRSFGYIF